jgi:regulator of PEP synthase PpsR (kinase-PPPase family)
MALRYIDVLSDSTGETAERVVRAALLQFPQSGVEIRRHPRVRTKQRAEPILEEVARDRSLLVFSVVSPELGEHIHRRTSELHIEAIDVIGAVIGRLGSYLERQPVNHPGPLLPLSEDYFRRIEAIDFTVKSDAGREPRSLLEADLVLVGVSRTSKTPLAMFLAQRGLKVASHTLVIGKELPPELARVTAERVIGLTIDAQSLCAMREERLRKLGMPADTQYAVRAHVEREIKFAEKVFADHPGWPVVDMSGRSVEETASIVLEVGASRPKS